MAEIIRVAGLLEEKQRAALLEKVNEIPAQYAGDIKRFQEYCEKTKQTEDMGAMLNYLAHSLDVQKVKKSTWERRLAAIKKHLLVVRGLIYTDDVKAEVGRLRSVYRLEEYKEQTHIKGQSAAEKDDIMDMIRGFSDARERAISLVALITANRPTEMVRLRIRDFDLAGRSVAVYLKKQRKWHHKRLTAETVKAVREYIRAYDLTDDSFFVGRVDRWGHYASEQITEGGYNKMIHRLLGFAPYTLRKTQVAAMHENGADLPTIAKQTGHKSLETLSRHYLTIGDKTIDKYL